MGFEWLRSIDYRPLKNGGYVVLIGQSFSAADDWIYCPTIAHVQSAIHDEITKRINSRESPTG